MADVEQIVGGGMLVGGGAGLAIALLKFGEVIVSRWPTAANREKAKMEASERAATAAADLIELAMQASGTSVSVLLQRLEAAEAKIVELEAENASCHALNREQTQKYESLEKWLRDQGIAVPANKRPGLILIEDGRAEMMTPATEKP